ncbi:hypothetical protein [Polyangium spumosum]|uniref:Uncharacterized protein n=1 Tax=Polyangium spumosum TaxID=889282 RepID=A0A6N7PI43_9BACT|nr:hypothetical protein [Polyangium spumosum]MRG91477.1 hypothetical protein [Polyangium spumosum]
MKPKILKTFALLAPFAALLAAPAPAAAGTSCVDLRCSSSASWSDSSFGASYQLWAGMMTKKDFPTTTSYGADYLRLGADIYGTAKAFGVSKSIVDSYAMIYNNNGSATGKIQVATLGIVLYSASMSNKLELGWTRSFFKADDGISILGVSIDLDAEVGGELGVNVYPQFLDGVVSLQADPYVSAYADVDAHVGASCASVGVSGSLTALDLHVPASIGTTIPEDNSVHLMMALPYELHSLDGKLKVKLKYCLDEDSKTIVNFDGFSTSATLLSKWGSFSW